MNEVSKARNDLYYTGVECTRLANAAYGTIDTETGEITDKDRFNEIQQRINELQGEMPHKLAQAACVWLEGQSELERIDGAIKRLQAIRAQRATGVDLLKVAIDNGCRELSVSSIESVVNGIPVKISYRKGERVEIDNMAELPPDCIRVKKEPDRVAIRQAIKQGREIDGAHLEETKNIQIK